MCILIVSGGDILQLESITGRAEIGVGILDDVEGYITAVMWHDNSMLYGTSREHRAIITSQLS